ncbi:MAG: DUF4918 family protein [Ignavibacteriales bacterium]|nr:MAG: DUF4918 family protein [Ignavibacteriales bacterium]
MLFSERAINFFLNLTLPEKLPDHVAIMNPYDSEETIKLVTKFYKNFFNDKSKRTFLVGINPGRFGGGLTGIAFTDPVNLQDKCGIKNNLDKKRELSSQFVYKLIDECGGTKKFYSRFFITALYPLALIKDGKNYNYYDSQKVYKALKPQIIQTFQRQIEFGANDKYVISFGKKNADYLKEINDELKFFKEIIIFDHPRFIMQYRLKKLDEYLKEYSKILRRIC